MTSNDRDMPPLIPAPRHFAYGAATEAFLIDATTEIVIGAKAGEETLFAARQAQAAVRDATGLAPALRRVYAPLDGAGRLALLRVDRDGGIPQETLAELGPEGYTLEVTPQQIVVAANTEAGLFYGVQTLRQLLRTQGRRIPALTIRDWPALAHRGVMLDISRGKVPTLQTLFALVDGLAEYKYNHLQLYTEHTFSFPSHPAISAGADPLTADDILALDRYCRERHIELVPNLQSYGHLRRMLSLPQYAHLDEVGWQWSLTPAREETYRLLDELYAEFLPAFSSRWFNVNCDETWDLGTGQSKALAQEIGIRLTLTGLLIAGAAGLADVLGFGSHPSTPETRPFLGRLQAIVFIGGILLASSGVLVYALFGPPPPLDGEDTPENGNSFPPA